MPSLVKFSGADLQSDVELTHPNIWQHEEFDTWSRLVIGARDGEIPLILDLCREMNGPFGILYVLTVTRSELDEGRYQNPEPADFAQLQRFALRFRAFLEQDGRHNFWVMSLSDEGQFIFDRHNFIYAYGDLERYKDHLNAAGFSEGEVGIPSPHAHHYHREFDATFDALMAYWDWKWFPLREHDI